MKPRIFWLAFPALLLGCLTPPTLKTECVQWDYTARKEWLPPGFKVTSAHLASSAGQIPNSGPVRLFISPTELPKTPAEGKALPQFQPLLAELGRPRWRPLEGSRVHLVEREAEADWVLESRLEMIWIKQVLAPSVQRQWDSTLLFRLRNRHNDQLLWGCVSLGESTYSDPSPTTARDGLEAQFGKHWAQLAQHLNAALNGSPGIR